MVQLQSCFFCGTAEAVTEYETLPKALRAHGQSQRVALCDRCQTKLTTVLSPVVEALDANESAPSRDLQGETGFASDDDSTVSAAKTDDSPTQTDVTFTAGEEEDAFPTATDEDDESSTVSDADEEEVTSTDDEDAVAIASEDESVTTAEESAAPVDEQMEDADTDSETRADRHTHTVGSAHAGGTGTGDELDVVYHKLLRFLRNREFPIPRTEAEGVAQSAYDLSSSDASTVIQRAVDRGVLEERGGELHRE